MDDLKDLVNASFGPLPKVCQEQILWEMERARMQAEDNQAALTRTEKKRKRLEEQREQALLHIRVVRDDLLHVYDERSGANEQQDFAVSVSINALTDIIDGMESDSDAES